MALIDKASLLMVPSTYEAGKLYNVLPSGNRAPDSTDQNSGYDQTRADFDFDRGSNAAATRVNASGLIEKGRENKLLQSNQFDTTWTNSSSTETGGQIGYDGTSNAWLLSKTSAGGRINQSVSLSGVQTLSMYAKAGSLNWMRFITIGGTTSSTYYDLENGTIGANISSIDTNIESVGNGWYRCIVTTNQPLTEIRIYPADGDNDTSGTSGSIFIQNAQLESGLVATDYLESTSVTGKAGVLVDLPRINYDANGENGALLLEPSRANKTEHAEYFEGWSRVNTGVAILDANAYTSPEGLQNAYKLTFTASGGSSQIYKVLNGFTIGTKYTQSLYVKYISGSGENFQIVKSFGTAGVRCTFTNDGTDLSVIAVGGTQANDFGKEPLGNGWFRIWFTYASNAGDWEINISRNTGTGSDVYAIYGHQIEAGSYPSSYIPNHGESGGVTRAADSCSVTGVSDVIGQTEGTLFIEAENNPSAYLFAAPNNVIFGSINSGNYLNNFHFTTDASKIYVYCNSGGTLYASPGTTLPSSSILKMAVTYTSSAIKFFLNGVLVGTDTSFNLPVGMNQIDVGHMGGQPATQKMRGGIDKFIVFTEAITDAEAITLTTL